MQKVVSRRNNSSIELLRIVLLFFIILTHSAWLGIRYLNLDVYLIRHISQISVVGFSVITGMYIYNGDSKKLFFRTISRILFVVIFSIIVSLSVIYSLGISKTLNNNLMLFTGSRDSWYIYMMLLVYLLAPFLKKTINLINKYYILVIAITIILAIAGYMMSNSHIDFYWSPIGFLFVFSMTLVGNYISRVETQKNKFIYILIFIIVLAISLYILSYYLDNKKWIVELLFKGEHEAIVNILLCTSVVVFLYKWPFYSAKINTLAKHSSFIYEFHWIAQIIWNYYFWNWTIWNNHLAFYVSSIAIFLVVFSLSSVLYLLKTNIWDKILNIIKDRYIFKVE